MAGFRDLFRTRLLWLHGGWWTDMDVTLIREIPRELLDAPIVLREHWCNHRQANVDSRPV